jgi:fumarate reductase flavoprotein subunit
MAWKIGAATSQIAFIKGTFGMYPWGPAPVNGLLAVYKGAVAVNREGRRFINESLSYKDLGEACLAESDAIAYQIFDSKVLALSDPSVPIYDFGPRLASGQIVSSDSLSGLSKSLDLPSEMFVETIDAYNRAVKGLESDAFNRTKLSGGIGTPTSIDSPPYYAFPSTTFLPGTYGGVEVDLTGSVLDVYGSRIPGLYAAGEVTGGFHGNGYVTGSALGKAAIFGQLAGRAAAEFALAARVK